MRPVIQGPSLYATLEDEAATERFGRAIASVARPGLVIGLVGGLGSGKTRLVRAVAETLGVDPRAIASPTFVLIHECQGRLPLYHWDDYRLKSIEEFEALGPDEYFEGPGVCLIEWADKVAERLPRSTWRLEFTWRSETSREIRLTIPDAPVILDTIAQYLETV